MATALPPPPYNDDIVRKLLFALELVDPLTGMPVTQGLKVTAEGHGPAWRVNGSAYIWQLTGEPAAQDIVFHAVSTDGRFRPLTAKIPVPANDGKTSPTLLGKRLRLDPTGLNLPPPGLTAVGGMLADDADPPGGVADVKVAIQVHALGPEPFTSAYEAVSDARGGFIAAAPDLDQAQPTTAPPTEAEGAVVGWLRIGEGADARFSGPLALRRGRLLRLAAPLKLSTLSQSSPA
ncbi:MAG: hypothetical protein JWO81_2575 [Alphaproteobacteria bacterium]|nr:hypothetical protein [Alphaproteobacteria bacterium]